MLTPCQAHKLFFARFFSFSGRSPRSEYWWCIIPSLIPLFFFSILLSIFSNMSYDDDVAWTAFGITWLINLFFFINVLSLSVRRLHDLNMSGAWCLIFFVPFGLFIILIIALFPSKHKTNSYGADPTADFDDFYQYYVNKIHKKFGPHGVLIGTPSHFNQPALTKKP